MIYNPYFYVWISLSIFLIFAYRIGKPQLISALDEAINTIRHSLDSRTEKRQSAQSLLQDELQLQEKMQQELTQIIDQARIKSKRYQDSVRTQTAATINEKRNAFTDLCQKMEQKLIQDLRIEAATKIELALEESFSQVNKADHETFLESSIQLLKTA